MRRSLIYTAIAVAAAIVVAQFNEQISATLGASSPAAALLVIALLPLLAIATRPVYIQVAQREQRRRVIGLIWALRSGKWSFLMRTVVLWIVVLAIVGGLVVVLYREGAAVAVATVANWIVVASALVFLLHIVPAGGTRLGLADRVSIFVLGPKGAGKTKFILLAPLDHLSKESATWTVHAGSKAQALTEGLYENDVPANVGTVEHTIMHRRVWSEFTGLRPRPVEFNEIPEDAPPTAWTAKRGSSGFAVVLRRELDLKLLREQLSRIRRIAAAKSKMSQPVAVVLTGFDSDPERSTTPEVGEDVRKLLDEFTRKWRVFLTTDRAGDDTEHFNPAGQVSAIAWLLGRM